MMYPKPIKIVSQELRDSARGEACTLRLPGVCTFGEAFLCHLPGPSSGTATKENDTHTAYGCSACHDAIDGRNNGHGLSGAIILDAMLRGHSETLARMVQRGLILVKGYNA